MNYNVEREVGVKEVLSNARKLFGVRYWFLIFGGLQRRGIAIG